MPVPAVSTISKVSTRSVPPAERIDFWQEYNRQALVGLTVSPYSEQGLLASQANLRMGALRLADIAGNEHVIERTPGMCRALPKDSVFASLLLSGEAVFLHRGGSFAMKAGDLALYDTRRSYLFGFSAPMHQVLVDIPREIFAEYCLPGGLTAPMRFTASSAAERPALTALRSALGQLAAGRPITAEADRGTLELVGSLIAGRLGGTPSGGRSALLVLAKDFIERRLTDPALCAGQVAAQLGISARHLSRVFAPEEVTPARYILLRRLAKAAEQLADPGSRDSTVADIAYHWGFASQAHFTRVFRDQYGHTPGETRPL
ncbi:helix-turn-helix domain-containing protein [Amycolatopsis cihanbeyliensis]|uniref:AraC family transcriptional regulator n=1 Tax=Amycolatopsis cihanbeyliensis TaxID=1128664 RepID=A0A542DNM6_AMYCI|nr:helix-turn-helix domain-containing protein [Amycolatopsis cihanbeyliensis]TQJ04565.1 AraC family transcriptional regulator [Amycolatopsis cihanbeyliensis]